MVSSRRARERDHPLVRQAAEKVAATRAALLAEVSNIKGAVARDLAVVQREEAGEEGLFDAARKRAVDLNMKEIEYHRLDRTRDENEKLYSHLLDRTKEAESRADDARQQHPRGRHADRAEGGHQPENANQCPDWADPGVVGGHRSGVVP